MMMYNNSSSEDTSDFEDEDFDQLIVMIAFPRKPRIFRPRKDHFTYIGETMNSSTDFDYPKIQFDLLSI